MRVPGASRVDSHEKETTHTRTDSEEATRGQRGVGPWDEHRAGLPEVGDQRGDLPSMEQGIRRGENGNGETAQGAGKGEQQAQEAGGRVGLGHGHAQGDRQGKVVGPARRREAVEHLQQTFGAGQRRACRVVEQPRSTQRYERKRAVIDCALTADILRLAGSEPRAGYRTVTRLLRREGWEVNPKRVHRIWKQEGLKVPAKRPQKRSRGNFENSCQKLKARRLNHVWSYDFIHDQTDDGGRLKWLPIVEEYSREVLSLEVARSITAKDVVENLELLVGQRGVPEYIRSDNGPEFVAHAVKDWIAARGFKTCFVEPGSPWQNAYIESFNSRFRDEFLNLEVFGSMVEAKVLGEGYRYKYNHQRPHSSLKDQTPAEFASRCPSPLRPPASAPMDSGQNPKL